MIENDIVTPSTFNELCINFGFYNDKGSFQPFDFKSQLKNKIYINYYSNGKLKPFKFTYDYKNLSWDTLMKGIVSRHNYFNSSNTYLRMDFIIEIDKSYLNDLKIMLEKIQDKCKTFIAIYYQSDKLEDYIMTNICNCDRKNSNIVYFNNIKFKYIFGKRNDNNSYKTKIFMKTIKDGSLINELITEFDEILKKHYFTIPVIQLSNVYTKIVDKKIYITCEFFLEESILYKNNVFVEKKEYTETDIDTSTINENTYYS